MGTCSSFMALVIYTQLCKKGMPEWEKLPNQVGSTKITVPEVETVMQGVMKKSYWIATCITAFVALIWHFGTPVRLTGGSTVAFFLALVTLWISIGWIIREMSWTQHKYDVDQHVNMCISFHVDLYCIFILFTIFCFFIMSESCNAGPLMFIPTCAQACAVQGHRCSNFMC